MPRRRLLLDLAPLRDSRQFRLLYVGQVVSFFGRQLTLVASAIQIFDLTGSSFQVGLLSAAQLGPLVVLSLYGGALADQFDRRKLLLVANVLLAGTSSALAVNAMVGHPQVWPLYVFTALNAGFSGLDSPTRSAAIPSIVGRDLIPAAAALNQTGIQLGQVIGPSVAGLIIARWDLAAAYWIDAATFAFAIGTQLLMAPMIPEGGGTKAGVRSIVEGLRYVRSERVVQGTFLVDVNAMVFGMPRALFPQLAADVFGGGASTVGLLYAAPGAGALVAAVTTGWVGGVRKPGRAVLFAVALWGASIAAFGLTTALPLGLVFLAIAGAADVISAVFRGTILQLHVPDRLRGRLNAVNIAVVTGGPRLGDLEAGAVAAATTVRISVVSGGLACLLGVGAIARFLPELERWHPAPVEPQPEVVEPGR